MGRSSWDISTADGDHVVELRHGALTQRVRVEVDGKLAVARAPRDPFEYYEWSSGGSSHAVEVGGAWRTIRVKPGLWGYGHELLYEGEPPRTSPRVAGSAHRTIVVAAHLFGLATVLLVASLRWEPHRVGTIGTGIVTAGAVAAWAVLAQDRYLRRLRAVSTPAEPGWVILVAFTNIGAVAYAALIAYVQTRDPAPLPDLNDPTLQLLSILLTVPVVFAVAYGLAAPLGLLQLIARTATGSWPGDARRIALVVGATIAVLLLIALIEGASDWYRPVRGLTVLSFGLLLAIPAYALGRSPSGPDTG